MQELTMMNAAGPVRPIETENQILAAGHIQKGRGDRTVTVMAAAGVTILTGLGWVLSYTALRQLALSAGMAAWAATLWPLCVGGHASYAATSDVDERDGDRGVGVVRGSGCRGCLVSEPGRELGRGFRRWK